MNICGRREKFTNMVVLLVCFAMLWGCGGSNVDETPVSDASTEEAASSAVVVNPNLAGSDEFGALMSKEPPPHTAPQPPFLPPATAQPAVSNHTPHHPPTH
ncbi:MAG: hypothetical protein OXG87_14330, partial [Gemmatimonadetes bacterium]|nr:hypothetical protein [Gemmatimonadota bacterium]